MIQNFIYVALGGAIGSTLRYSISLLPFTQNTILATLIANTIGCFLIGLLFAFLQSNKINQSVYILLATGLCGGFTTFSTFSIENIQFLQQQKWMSFALYTLSTVTLCMVTTYIGWLIASNK